MPPTKQRGSKVIYVAGSARDFPDEVQEWLGQAGNRSAASPNVYDLLARLACGTRPRAIIVSIDAVDWNEMEFFRLAARLSRGAQIYVCGHEHQQDRIEAACALGAVRFDADQLKIDLSAPPQPQAGSGAGGLVAGVIGESQPETPGKLPPSTAPVVEPRLRVQPIEQPVEQPVERPAVRLVRDEEPEEAKPETRVPVPWAPAPDRPQRVPPAATGQSPGRGSIESGPATGTSRAPAPASSRSEGPIELTAEELAALIGKPIELDDNSPREQKA